MLRDRSESKPNAAIAVRSRRKMVATPRCRDSIQSCDSFSPSRAAGEQGGLARNGANSRCCYVSVLRDNPTRLSSRAAGEK